MLRALALSCLVLSVLSQKDQKADSNIRKESRLFNVALGKPTKQSSVGWSGTPEKAVDGRTSGRYWDGTCTHGNNEGVQFWEVDLEAVYNIDHIEVYGRTDCCSDRLEGAKLWIGNNKCANLKNMGTAQVEKVTCDDPADSVGRRIRIEVLNYLTLCEVKVFTKTDVEIQMGATDTPAVHMGEVHGMYTNVALHKQSTQSSERHGGVASRGNDGYNNTHWNHKTCTFTQNGGMNYWEVDLGRVYKIDHMMLYSRSDREQNYLNGATVKVGSVACQTLASMEKGNKARITCDGDSEKLTGQVVRVEKWGTVITVCELQIFVKNEDLPDPDQVIPTVNYKKFGEVIDEYFNVAKGKNTSASSEPWGGKASRAVDGTRNQHWGMGSCTHTNNRGNEWWKVDLGRVYQIHHIRIWGRTDAHQDRLEGARLWIGDHRCGKLTSMGKEAKADVITCPPEVSAGRYVTIEHLNQYITLCEVQVMVKQSMIEVEPNTVSSDGEKLGNYTNVALRKNSWQTSTGWGGEASRAVDGWVKTHWNSGSCTHTNQQGLHEWHVDLGKVYKVDHLKFWGRTDNDHYQKRIMYVKAFVGRTYCGYLTEEAYEKGMPFTLQCSNEEQDAFGQIVTFQRLADYLTLCEVQVMVKNEDLEEGELPTTYPSFENVARNKPTSQSTTAHGGVSKRAVDGFTSTSAAHWHRQSCTHTERQAMEYWEVDLEDEYYIDHITILGRSDCCGDRLDEAVITMDNKTVAGLSYYKGQLEWTIPMKYARGRRLRVTLLNEYLTICEFAVYVDHDYDPTTDMDNQLDLSEANLALKRVATSSSVAVGGEAWHAVDGNTEANFYRGSCASTDVQQGVHWWSVDLVDSHNVGHIIVFPRLDKNTKSYLDGAVVFVGENACGTIEYLADKQWYRIDCKGVSGSSVTVKKESGYLQFCEVIVQAAED